MTRKKKVIVGILLLCIIAAAALCIRSPVGIALLKSRRHFIAHSADARVRYEPGAEIYAAEIAEYLPKAVRFVEQEQSMPFKDNFTVYVCATQKSLNEYVAEPSLYPVRGSAFHGAVFISPSAFSFRGQDTHEQTLIHELAHLHMQQIIGYFKYLELPVWFREGVANCMAGSGGEGIPDDEAISAILSGRHFVVTEKGSIFKPFHHAFSGITPVMFHKQNRMFVQYIKHNYPGSFRQLMLDLYSGKQFAPSFSRNFGSGVMTVWNIFVDHITVVHGQKDL